LIGAQYRQRIFVFMHGCDHTIGQIVNGLTVFVGAANDFVVNISDVSHIVHIPAT
jgi:hypothetical protein